MRVRRVWMLLHATPGSADVVSWLLMDEAAASGWAWSMVCRKKAGVEPTCFH